MEPTIEPILAPSASPILETNPLDMVLSLIGSFIAVPIILFLLIFIGLVLYYYTGEKKRADKFWPKLMSQSLRTYSYVWLTIIAVTGFIGVTGILNGIFTEILPTGRFADDSVDGETIVKYIVLTIIAILLGFFKMFINRMNLEVSKIAGTASTKIFVSFGLIIFSIIFFASLISSSMNIIEYFYEDRRGIDAMLVSIVFSSFFFWLMFAKRGMEILKSE